MKPLAAHGQRQGLGTLKQPSQAIAKLAVNRLGEKHIYGYDFAKQVRKKWILLREEATHQLMRLLHEITYT